MRDGAGRREMLPLQTGFSPSSYERSIYIPAVFIDMRQRDMIECERSYDRANCGVMSVLSRINTHTMNRYTATTRKAMTVLAGATVSIWTISADPGGHGGGGNPAAPVTHAALKAALKNVITSGGNAGFARVRQAKRVCCPGA